MCIDQRKRPVRNTNNTRLADAIAAEQVDEYGTKPFQRRILQPCKTTSSRKCKQADDASTDVDNDSLPVPILLSDSILELADGLGTPNLGREDACVIFIESYVRFVYWL
jgi:hypothetical protein